MNRCVWKCAKHWVIGRSHNHGFNFQITVGRVFWQPGDISASSSSAMHRAFVDMWLLGETVSVITTCGSTFGYVAHARSNLKPIVVTLDTAEAIQLNTSEPCMHTWPFLLELKCFRGNFRSAMAQFGHPHCRPWDMCVRDSAFSFDPCLSTENNTLF
jgi:hypothetical protein